MDAHVHGLDVAEALDRRLPVPPEVARACAEHPWSIGFPFRARTALRGFRLVATDVDRTAGDGRTVRGPIEALLPLLAGRSYSLDRLDGAGADLLRSRRRPVGAG